jgi:hypothetical protein
MTTNDWFKACGLLSVLLTWSAIAFVIYRAPRDLSKSISHHAALQKREYRVFAVTMTLALCLMYVIALAVMFILMLVFLTIKKAHERYLVYQSIYIAAFHIAIISIALLS